MDGLLNPTYSQVKYFFSSISGLHVMKDFHKADGRRVLVVRNDLHLAEHGMSETKTFTFHLKNERLQLEEVKATHIPTGSVKAYYRNANTDWVFMEKLMSVVR